MVARHSNVSIEPKPTASREPTRCLRAGGGLDDLPHWLGRVAPRQTSPRHGDAITVAAHGGEFVHVRSVVVRDAEALDPARFEAAARAAYAMLLDGPAGSATWLVRAWNFVPAIDRALGPQLDRYMNFNAGRRAAFAGHGWAEGTYPASTGVGHAGSDLVVHGLFAPWPCEPVENPRQVPAWRYSRRYGPASPTFARAAVLDRGGRAIVLVAGTASVVGEDSAHRASLEGQIDETLRNLRALLAAALGDGACDPLARLSSLRAYVPRCADVDAVAERLATEHALHACDREIVCAPLCRRDLLVEIEGVCGDAAAWE